MSIVRKKKGGTGGFRTYSSQDKRSSSVTFHCKSSHTPRQVTALGITTLIKCDAFIDIILFTALIA